MKKVWVVSYSSDSYEDERTVVAGVFDTKEEAQKSVDLLEKKAADFKKKREELYPKNGALDYVEQRIKYSRFGSTCPVFREWNCAFMDEFTLNELEEPKQQ